MDRTPKKRRNESLVLDDVDRALVLALAEDARTTTAELARSVGLSPPTVAERLRRLEDQGPLRGYTVDLDHRALGFSLTAIVRVRPFPGQLHVVEKLLMESPEVIECDKVTGEDCFMARCVLRSVEELDEVLDRIAQRAETSTSIIKKSPVKRRLPPLDGT